MLAEGFGKRLLLWFLIMLMACNSLFTSGLKVVYAEGIPIIPEVLITELLSNPSGEFDGNDWFEFVELYNSSSKNINLKDYLLIYSSYGGKTKKVNDIAVNKEIAPGETAVLWLYTTYSAEGYGEFGSWTYDITTKFREHYGIAKDIPVYMVNATVQTTVNGKIFGYFNLANSGIKDVMVAKDTSKVDNTTTYSDYISNVVYNYPSNTAADDNSTTDSKNDRSVMYTYPTDNSKRMVKLATEQLPTPGTINYMQKPINYNDPQAPVILHQPLSSIPTEGLTITANASDDLDLRYVKLYYETKGTQTVKSVDMKAAKPGTDEYVYTISTDEIAGSPYVKYYIEASDGLHTVTSPEDKNAPYTLYTIDNDGPVVNILNPVDKNCFYDYLRPVIHAGYSDVYGVDLNSVKLFLNGQDITSQAVITDKSIIYTPTYDLSYGKYTINLELSDLSPNKNKTTKTWTFTINKSGVSAGPVIPEILITEILANPVGEVDANGVLNKNNIYEFVELYNASNHDINLKDYKLMYYPYLNIPEDIRIGDLTDDAIIYPGQVAVVWIYSADSKEEFRTGDSFTLDENTKNMVISKFRKHYSMPESIPVYLMHGDSKVIPEGTTTMTFHLHNSDQKTLMVARDSAAAGEYISTATYNDDPDSNDVVLDKSIIYTYPTDNSNKMVKIRAGMDATPGKISYSQKPANYNDTTEPVIKHEQTVTSINPAPVEITATITDETELRSAKLYYETFNTNGTVSIDMLENQPGTDIYSAVIPEKDILGSTYIKYYIEAGDGLHTVSLPIQKENPYVISVKDLQGPDINKIKPSNKFYVEENYRPTISAEYADASGIDLQSVKMFLDGLEVTEHADITSSDITYIPDKALEGLDHEVRLEIRDASAQSNQTVKTWEFRTGPQVHNLYNGQIHSHSNYSDGAGTPDEAYAYARDTAKKRFFGLTDHAHYLSDDTWRDLLNIADSYNVADSYATIPGFEMTWNNNIGWWGHMNSYNTGWVETKRNTPASRLPNYYTHIGDTPESVSQFNHPGYLWGDFGEYGYYSEEADAVIDLMEVRTLAHELEYAKALDKGWHISPTNNEDNHNGEWAKKPNATVVVAPRLTRDNILEAFHKNRTYAAQDDNLQILYLVNNQIMGSRLDNPDKLSFNIDFYHPTQNIGIVTVFTDRHSIAATQTFNTNDVNWTFELPAVNSYYYVRVEQPNGNLAFTAPVWVENQKPISLSLEVGLNEVNQENPVQVRAGITNNGGVDLADAKLEFFRTNTLDSGKIGEFELGTVASGESRTILFNTLFNSLERTIYAKVSGKSSGIDTAAIEVINVPELLITEIVPNSSKDKGINSDAYDFIEVYNNSNNTIDIANYQIQLYESAGASVTTWDITANRLIQPKSTMVIWTKPSEATVAGITYADFNARYGTNLSIDQIVEISGVTLPDIGGKTLFIARDGSSPVKLSQARYNVELSVNEDTPEDKSIQYRYSADDTDISRKIAAGQIPTPGLVTRDQVPYVNSISDASLSNLVVDRGVMTPVFNYGTANYQLTVSNDVYRIGITPIVSSDVYKSLTINDRITVSGATYYTDLTIGTNIINIKIVAGNNTDTQTYTITATREAGLSSDASLSSLVLNGGILNPVFSPNSTEYAVSVGYGVSSITVTPTVSSAVYKSLTVLGNELVSGDKFKIDLPVGQINIPIVVTAQDGTIKIYTITVRRAEPSSSGGIPADSKTENNTVVVTVEGPVIKVQKPILDSSTGQAKAVIDETAFNQALAKAMVVNGTRIVTIEISKTQGAASYLPVLPVDIFRKNNNMRVEVKTENGIVILTSEMIAATNLEKVKDIGLQIGTSNKEKLPENVKASVGNRPLIQINLIAEGKIIQYSNPEVPVIVKVPYTLTAEEKNNSEHIVVWYIDGNGKVTSITNGRYDSATENVIFTTTHFGSYAIAYVFKTFEDIEDYSWAKESIEVMASKGIIQGVSAKNYAPGSNINRADFTMLLVKTLGLNAKIDSNFKDVSKDAYYYEAVGIARKLGLIKGVGDDTFTPDTEITREEMLVITARAMKLVKKFDDTGTSAELNTFVDRAKISEYAVNDIATMVKEGLVKGSDNRVNPSDNTTRAEAAVLLYRVYKK